MGTEKLVKLKTTIQKGRIEISNIDTKSKEFNKILLSAMNDDVGYGAVKSNDSIKNKITTDLNQGYNISNNSVSELSAGHIFNQKVHQKANEINKQAEEIYKEILEYEKNFPRSR